MMHLPTVLLSMSAYRHDSAVVEQGLYLLSLLALAPENKVCGRLFGGL